MRELAGKLRDEGDEGGRRVREKKKIEEERKKKKSRREREREKEKNILMREQREV